MESRHENYSGYLNQSKIYGRPVLESFGMLVRNANFWIPHQTWITVCRRALRIVTSSPGILIFKFEIHCHMTSGSEISTLKHKNNSSHKCWYRGKVTLKWVCYFPQSIRTGNNMFCHQTKGILEAKLEIVKSYFIICYTNNIIAYIMYRFFNVFFLIDVKWHEISWASFDPFGKCFCSCFAFTLNT